jgi:hypothetical protein
LRLDPLSSFPNVVQQILGAAQDWQNRPDSWHVAL